MSQLYVPGPSEITVVVGGVPRFLGWTEEPVRPSFRGYFRDVNIDATGGQVPYDVLYMGQDAIIQMTMVKYNHGVMDELSARLPGREPGQILGMDIGTLLNLEGFAVGLVIKSRYYAKAVFSGGGMRPGLHFPVCYLADQFDEDYGTTVKTPRFTLRAIPRWDASFAGRCYDFDMSQAMPPN